MIPPALTSRLDLDRGIIEGALVTERRLSDVAECFGDSSVCREILVKENPLLYTVSTVTPAEGEGQLHYGLGRLMPGKVGDEYFLTKGHYHAWREAAEVYVGLCGEGMMLLEDEPSGESRLLPLGAGNVVYVPGRTAHRTINVSRVPLVYLGIYPAAAGHDYGAIAQRNFRQVVIDQAGRPAMLDRAVYLASLPRREMRDG
jgi:glucose-6-phosphate isomerase, archaeal